MPTEIAVGQRAEPLQFRKGEPFGMHDEGRHDSQSRFFVQGALEAVVRETPGPLITFGSSLPDRHKPPRDGTIPRL